jgi:hypothetical protein
MVAGGPRLVSRQDHPEVTHDWRTPVRRLNLCDIDWVAHVPHPLEQHGLRGLDTRGASIGAGTC